MVGLDELKNLELGAKTKWLHIDEIHVRQPRPTEIITCSQCPHRASTQKQGRRSEAV